MFLSNLLGVPRSTSPWYGARPAGTRPSSCAALEQAETHEAPWRPTSPDPVPLRSFDVDPAEAGERLDRLAARRLDTSRSIIQRIIQEGLLRVDGEVAGSSYRVRGGERVEARLPERDLEPEEIPVPVVFEDEFLLVVDKPAGLVVHPGAGNPSGTLVNALLGEESRVARTRLGPGSSTAWTGTPRG